MKKIISVLLLSITLLFSAVATPVSAEEIHNFTVKVSDVDTTAGESQVAVDINLENNPGIAGFSFCVNFDTDKLVLVEAKINIDDGHKVIARPTGYGVNLAWTSASEYTQDGTIATLYFNVPRDLTTSEANIEIVYRDGYDSFYDTDENDISVQTVNGKATIKAMEESSSPAVNIGEVSTTFGENDIVVPISVENNPGISGFSFCVNYDTNQLVLESVDILLDDGYEVIAHPDGYGVNIAWTSTKAYTTDGTIAELHFSLTDNADSRKAFINAVLRDGYDGFYSFTDGQERDIVFEVFDGYIEVKSNRNYAFSQNVQIGLIEPWFLRANAKVYISGDTSKTPIDYDTELNDYGFYFIRESKLGIEGATADNVTAEQIIACEFSVRYSKTNGKSHIKDGYAYADFDEGLYTYELSDSVFTVFFIEYEGKTVYAKVRERNLKELVDTYKVPGVGNFSDEERAVFAAMSQMESDITAYRAGFDSIPPLALQTAPTLAENPLGAVTANTPYKFSRNYQVVLIEPWGLAINGKVKLDGNVIDYSTMQDYGVVVFYDVNGIYSSMDTETLLACDEAYVFSKQNGDAELNGEYIHAVYNKGIYSYQMTSKAYVMFYVQDADGNYHYSAVKEKTIQSAIQGVLGVSTSQTEINVLNDMLVLHQAVVDYRASLDE